MPKKKPRIGRPPKKPSEKEITPKRYYRCSDELYAEFEAAAASEGLSTSEWTRKHLTKAARRSKRTFPPPPNAPSSIHTKTSH